jgi:hypothetical protein
MFHRAALLSVLVPFAVLLGASPALAGEGLAPSPAQLEFGAVDMHFGGSPRQSVGFSNPAVSAVLVGSAAIAPGGSSAFQIVDDGCSGKLLAPTESCSVEVEFHPAAGPQSASLELLAGEASVAVPLSGSGITGTLSASPNPLSFAPIPYNQPSHEGEYQESEPLNIQNSHDASTQIESASISGPDASSFSIAWGGNCEHELLGTGSSCGMGIRFAPTSPGPKSASLVFHSDSSGAPLDVPLSGEALHGPSVSLSSSQALLGDVQIGSSAQATFTVTNTGDYPLFVQQDFLVSGTPLMFPITSDTCGGQIVHPGASCSLTVGFEPTTSGEKDAAIILITNSSPINVLGIDGVAVRPVVVSIPNLTTPLASPPADSPTVPAAGAASEPSTAEAAGAAPAPALVIARAPRLRGSIARAVLETGVIAQCPAQLQGCETVSFLTASIAARSARAPGRAPRSTPVLLGSALTQLRGGQSSRVRVPLSARALALLRQRGRLRARVETIVRVGGRVRAERALVVALTPPG